MTKNILTILPAIVAVILAVMLISAKKELHELKKSHGAVALAQGEMPADPGNTPPLESAQELVEQTPARPETNDVDAAMVDKTLKNHQRVMSSIAKMRDNPTMNKMIEASQRGTIGALYADMIEYLKLDADETKYLMDLLMYRQMEQVDFGMKLMSGQLTEEQKKEMGDHLAQVSNETKEQIKKFLNSDDDYNEFEFYEKTIGERMALSQMDQKLSGSEQELSNTDYRELLDMMHQERSGFDWSTDLHEQENSDISADRFSKDNMKKHTDDVHRLNEQIFAKALSILSPEQLEAFKASIAATTDMQLAQFEMAGQLLRGGE